MKTWSLIAGLAAIAFQLDSVRTPSSALLVLNKDEAVLAIVDPATRRVVGRVTTGDGPHEVAVTGDGRIAYVANYGAGSPGRTISVIDVPSQKELRRVDLGSLRRPHGIAVAGDKVYFTAEANRTIARLDRATNQVDWRFDTEQAVTHMVVVSKDLTKIFTANIGSDSITIVERGADRNAWSKTTVPVGRGPEGIDLSPDGRELWAAHSQDGGVSIVDVSEKKVIQTLNLRTRRSNRLKFAPDGRLVLVSDLDGGELVVIDAAARREIKRVRLGANPAGIQIAPDGKRAYVALTGDNAVAEIDMATLEETARIATGSGPDGMVWAERR